MKLRTVKWLTVEPALLLYTVAYQIAMLVDLNLVLQKACHPELTEQPDPSLKCENEAGSQKIVTDIYTWKPILQSILSSAFIIFIGQWSDTHGRRRMPMLIIPVVGEIVTLLLVLLSVYFWTLPPELTALLGVFRGITGGSSCVVAGCLIYISDVTTEEERTTRIGFMGSMNLLGSAVGSSLGSFLRVRFNFVGTYVVCIVMCVAALFFAVVLVKSTVVEETDLELCEGVFYPKNIIENFRTLVKKRDDSKRIVLILMFLVTPLLACTFAGEYSVLYLYARYKFRMEEGEYGYYLAYRRISIVIGVGLIIGIFCKLLKLSDAKLGLICSISQVVSGLVNSMTQNEWQLIAFPLLDLMSGGVAITSRSLLTKIIDPHEYGRISSLQGALDSFVPIFAVPLYSKFYKLTFESMAGAFFLLNSCISLVMLSFFIVALYVGIKERKNQNTLI